MKIKTEHRFFLRDNHSKALVSITEYDTSGNCIKEVRYNENGHKESETNCVFNEKNKMVKETTWSSDSDETTVNEFIYDNNNELVQEKLIYSDGSFEHKDYTSEGNKIIRKSFDAENELTEIQTTEISGDKKMHITVTDASGELILQTAFIYNEKGQLEEDRAEDYPGMIRLIEKYEYDEEGHLAKREAASYYLEENNDIIDDPGLLIEKEIAQYKDQKHIRTDYQNTQDPIRNHYIISEYTETGLLSQYSSFRTDGHPNYVFTFFYNEKGELAEERKVFTAQMNEFGASLSPVQEFVYEREYHN